MLEQDARPWTEFRNGVSVVHVAGRIERADETDLLLRRAIYDPDVRGVVLALDCPDGESSACRALAVAVECSASVKPLVVYVETALGSSVLPALAGGRIVLSPSAQIGLGRRRRFSERVKTFFLFGVRLAARDNGHALEIVRHFRGSAAANELRGGRILTSDAASKAGLADKVGSLQDAVAIVVRADFSTRRDDENEILVKEICTYDGAKQADT